MSGELATLLSGRYVELKILPLSFKEFYLWHKDTTLTRSELFNKYLKSAFPYMLFAENNEERRVYLEGLFNTILLNDIVTRKKVSNVSILQRMIETLFSMIGCEININKIANTLRSKNIKITNQTLERWLDAILDSFVMYQVRKFDIRRIKSCMWLIMV
jgi:predicted AAA+ superfamily ATPase